MRPKVRVLRAVLTAPFLLLLSLQTFAQSVSLDNLKVKAQGIFYSNRPKAPNYNLDQVRLGHYGSFQVANLGKGQTVHSTYTFTVTPNQIEILEPVSGAFRAVGTGAAYVVVHGIIDDELTHSSHAFTATGSFNVSDPENVLFLIDGHPKIAVSGGGVVDISTPKDKPENAIKFLTKEPATVQVFAVNYTAPEHTTTRAKNANLPAWQTDRTNPIVPSVTMEDLSARLQRYSGKQKPGTPVAAGVPIQLDSTGGVPLGISLDATTYVNRITVPTGARFYLRANADGSATLQASIGITTYFLGIDSKTPEVKVVQSVVPPKADPGKPVLPQTRTITRETDERKTRNSLTRVTKTEISEPLPPIVAANPKNSAISVTDGPSITQVKLSEGQETTITVKTKIAAGFGSPGSLKVTLPDGVTLSPIASKDQESSSGTPEVKFIETTHTFKLKPGKPLSGDVVLTTEKGGGTATLKIIVEPAVTSMKFAFTRHSMIVGEDITVPVTYLGTGDADVTKLVTSNLEIKQESFDGDLGPEDLLRQYLGFQPTSAEDSATHLLISVKKDNPSEITIKALKPGHYILGATNKGSNIKVEISFEVFDPVQTSFEVLPQNLAQDLYGAQIAREFFVGRVIIQNNRSQAYNDSERKAITILPATLKVLVEASDPIYDRPKPSQTNGIPNGNLEDTPISRQLQKMFWEPPVSYSLIQDSEIARRQRGSSPKFYNFLQDGTKILLSLNSLASQSTRFDQSWNLFRGNTALQAINAFQAITQASEDRFNTMAKQETSNIAKIFAAGSQLVPSGGADERVVFIPKTDIRGYLSSWESPSKDLAKTKKSGPTDAQNKPNTSSANNASPVVSTDVNGRRISQRRPKLLPLYIIKVFPNAVRLNYLVTDDKIETTAAATGTAEKPTKSAAGG